MGPARTAMPTVKPPEARVARRGTVPRRRGHAEVSWNDSRGPGEGHAATNPRPRPGPRQALGRRLAQARGPGRPALPIPLPPCGWPPDTSRPGTGRRAGLGTSPRSATRADRPPPLPPPWWACRGPRLEPSGPSGPLPPPWGRVRERGVTASDMGTGFGMVRRGPLLFTGSPDIRGPSGPPLPDPLPGGWPPDTFPPATARRAGLGTPAWPATRADRPASLPPFWCGRVGEGGRSPRRRRGRLAHPAGPAPNRGAAPRGEARRPVLARHIPLMEHARRRVVPRLRDPDGHRRPGLARAQGGAGRDDGRAPLRRRIFAPLRLRPVLPDPAEVVQHPEELPPHRRRLPPQPLRRRARGHGLAAGPLGLRLGLEGLQPADPIVRQAQQERPRLLRRPERPGQLAPHERGEDHRAAPPRLLPGQGEERLAIAPSPPVQGVERPEHLIDPGERGDVDRVVPEQPHEPIAAHGVEPPRAPDPLADPPPEPDQPRPPRAGALQLAEDRPGLAPEVVGGGLPPLQQPTAQSRRPHGPARLGRPTPLLRPPGRPPEERRALPLGLIDLPRQLRGPPQKPRHLLITGRPRRRQERRHPPLDPRPIRLASPRRRLPPPRPPRPAPIPRVPDLPPLRPWPGREPLVPPARLGLGLGRHRRVPPRRG
ncbi:hypothetical protein OJF2_02280 [Aquisphaera giovannonii]|uniref:Uncharacterized protein n=1 Tax=Aquisphaera giovannonii TaxID=406548 RepID=A0A5B9VTS8_9BACT|nr:hypothetical protein OJF2_02280 [Aquisphaera giovannonii]